MFFCFLTRHCFSDHIVFLQQHTYTHPIHIHTIQTWELLMITGCLVVESVLLAVIQWSATFAIIFFLRFQDAGAAYPLVSSDTLL